MVSNNNEQLKAKLRAVRLDDAHVSKAIADPWTRIKREHGLYRYNPSGQFFARVRFRGKLHRRKLKTDDLDVAKRKLRDFKNDLERTDASKGNTSFAAVLDAYSATLKGSESTLEKKRAIIQLLKQTLFGADSLPVRIMQKSQLAAWLSKYYGDKSASHYNSALTVIRDALDAAVDDGIILKNPIRQGEKPLKYLRRPKPIRLTPTFEQFKLIVADIRAQRFNREAEQSGDFVEFLGLAGLGQAEAAGLTRAHVDLDSGQFLPFRHKTTTGFAVPIFPQLRPLMEKLCAGKQPHERLFKIKEARKALANSCRRLRFLRELEHGRMEPQFTHRSLRRMFISRAIERGVDVKVIAEWQGHGDGGRLILETYSHVRPAHSIRMAQLMTDGEPANVIPITAAS
jgi:integrase